MKFSQFRYERIDVDKMKQQRGHGWNFSLKKIRINIALVI